MSLFKEGSLSLQAWGHRPLKSNSGTGPCVARARSPLQLTCCPLPALGCIHTTCIPSFVPQFHFSVCDSPPFFLCLDNFPGLFRTQPKCHFIMKPFKTLSGFRLDTLPGASISPCASLTLTLLYYNCLSTGFHSY